MTFGGSSALMAPRVDRTIGSRTSARWGAPSGPSDRSDDRPRTWREHRIRSHTRTLSSCHSSIVKGAAAGRDLVSTRIVGTTPAGV
jgi:hypothetical protein